MEKGRKALLGAGKDILQGFRALVLARSTAEAPDQRRRLTRLRCLYRVACSSEGEDFRATVVDMGLKGMRLEVPRRLPAGALVSVRYLGSSTADRRFSVDTVHTRILWCRKKRFLRTIEIGVAYHDSEANMERSWVKYILRQIGFDIQSILDRRKAVRVQALLRADLKGGRGLSEGTVINLGAGGALFETQTPVDVGAHVTMEAGPYLTHDMLTVRGTVVQTLRSADSGHWLVGVCFENVTATQANLLGSYVKTLLEETLAE